MKSSFVTIQMKTTEQHFSLVLFDMLYKVLIAFVSVAIQMKATEKYFPLVLFDVLFKVLSCLWMKSFGCDNSNESYDYDAQLILVHEIPRCDHCNEHYFPTFESVDRILTFLHTPKLSSYWQCGIV